ncbi:hypothetical protein ACKLK6_14850 [Klebsiella pneumoniae]|uniref:hypothetical protein n=1 Tax=Klebsiella pneumoniae TaxID=573 RepID=UPI003B27BE62
MTSKFSIDNRELLQRISSGEAVVGIDFGNLIVRELAAFRMAAMDSEPDCKERKLFCSTDTARMRKAISVSAGTDVAQPYRHAQQPVVSAELLHTAASAIEDLLTTKDRMGVYVCFDLPFRLRSAANAQPAPELKPVGYLFVSDQGAITYSPTDWGMPGFKLAGQIFGDIDVELKPAPVVPEGYKLVPTELTSEMVKAFRSFCEAYDVDLIAGYKAMLAAAPQETNS